MAKQIETLAAIAADYDVIVFDQWGVLHNGTSPYGSAVTAINTLESTKAVLSNSGKRSGPNLDRITNMGFPEGAFDFVMTSGEALWRDVDSGEIPARTFFPVERSAGDAALWAAGLSIELVTDVSDADGVLLMGLPDGSGLEDWEPQMDQWLSRELPVYCSNPDRKSPRAGGLVISPGALGHAYEEKGGPTAFYGKPHLPVFSALTQVYGEGRYLMVGDSMEHDIAGAQNAGWDSLLVQNGLYADRFAAGDTGQVVTQIAEAMGCQTPTYMIKELA